MPQWRPDEIAYCANVHPGTTAAEISENIRNISAQVRRTAGLPHLQLGLWVCERAQNEYQNPALLADLKNQLESELLSVVTLNGFPQGDFHQAVVKHSVYQPRWSDKSRLEYTQNLASLLAQCLPDHVSEGTISTLPLAYRLDWNADLHRQACLHLCDYVHFAKKLFLDSGKRIRLCLEMEPGCVLQNTSDIVHFFTIDLIECANDCGISASDIDQYLGICFDICHQAVMQEDLLESLAAIHAAGIVIGKIQVSSALNVVINASSLVALSLFAEPKYLHQCTVLTENNQSVFFDDLAEALNTFEFCHAQSARIHFHLPIQSRQVTDGNNILADLCTTQDAILQVLDALTHFNYKPHIEIETYTWQVLPEFKSKSVSSSVSSSSGKSSGENQSLILGLVAEHNWLLAQMRQRNLIVE